MQLIEIIAKAVHEPDFRERFITQPKIILQEMEVDIPPTQNVTVLESRSGEIFFVLPLLTDEEATQLSASLATVHPQRSARSRILLRAREDPTYKAQLFKKPNAILKEEGIPIPESTTVTLLENSAQQLYIVLPQIHSHTH